MMTLRSDESSILCCEIKVIKKDICLWRVLINIVILKYIVTITN